MLTKLSHHLEAVDLLFSDDGCQGLIWKNHPSVGRVLEVVGLDVVPGPPDNLAHGGSLHADDCHEVFISLQLSSQVSLASVSSPVASPSSDPVSSRADSPPAFDQMISVVESPHCSESSPLHFEIF